MCFERAGLDSRRELLGINAPDAVPTADAVARMMEYNKAYGAGPGSRTGGTRCSGDAALAGYHLFPSVRGDLLMKMGRYTEARVEILRAISMTGNLREQELLMNKLLKTEESAGDPRTAS